MLRAIVLLQDVAIGSYDNAVLANVNHAGKRVMWRLATAKRAAVVGEVKARVRSQNMRRREVGCGHLTNSLAG